MPEAVVATGIGAQAIVWLLVARGRLPFWPATAIAFAALGIASLLTGEPAWCADTSGGAAVTVGIVSGLALYGATRPVVGLAARQEAIRRSVRAVYRRSEEAPFWIALLVSLLVAVPGEELFWRGLAVPVLQEAMSPVAGGVLAWAAAVAVNAVWASPPLLAGAVVGGALWTALAVWSAGVLAPVASHLVWTGLMLAWPPSAARAKVAG